MAIVGCARVFTDGQSVDAKVVELKGAGAIRIFHQKVSGAATDRSALNRAVAAVQAGDVLLVTKLHRLARSIRDLLNTLDAVATRSSDFRSLRDSWADTTTPMAG